MPRRPSWGPAKVMLWPIPGIPFPEWRKNWIARTEADPQATSGKHSGRLHEKHRRQIGPGPRTVDHIGIVVRNVNHTWVRRLDFDVLIIGCDRLGRSRTQ